MVIMLYLHVFILYIKISSDFIINNLMILVYYFYCYSNIYNELERVVITLKILLHILQSIIIIIIDIRRRKVLLFKNQKTEQNYDGYLILK